MFTGLACDFWQIFAGQLFWQQLGNKAYIDFNKLKRRFKDPFHYICMGSAVIHPEVFLKAVAGQDTEFRADVVDFLDMYRPRTRVAKYGKYYKTTHKEFLDNWLRKGDI